MVYTTIRKIDTEDWDDLLIWRKKMMNYLEKCLKMVE